MSTVTCLTYPHPPLPHIAPNQTFWQHSNIAITLSHFFFFSGHALSLSKTELLIKSLATATCSSGLWCHQPALGQEWQTHTHRHILWIHKNTQIGWRWPQICWLKKHTSLHPSQKKYRLDISVAAEFCNLVKCICWWQNLTRHFAELDQCKAPR